MRAALTGATGLLGANLAELLVQRGWTVTATRRASSDTRVLDDLPITWVEASLSDPDGLARAFDGADAVFHCAAQVTLRKEIRPEVRATNVDGTRNVLTAAGKASGRLVHVSTVACSALGEGGALVDETATYNFEREGLDDAYSRTKYEGELLVVEAARAGQDAVIVSPTFLFGPRDSHPSSGRVILEIAAGKLPALPRGWSCFVDARDVANGMLLAFERGERGERYILGGENRPWADMLQAIGRALGVRTTSWVAPAWVTGLVGLGGDLGQWVSGRELTINSMAVRWANTPNFRFTSEKAKRQLGYAWRDPDEAVAAAIQWFRAQGRLPR